VPDQSSPTGKFAALLRTPSALVVAATLTAAALLGMGLGFWQKAACRAGAWNTAFGLYQAHCYTDIYPLYFGEGLAAKQVPYFGHPVEYPVGIGAAMQAVAWLVRPISNPYIRGREFFDVTTVLLALFAVATVLATGYLAGRSMRWSALLVALSPALILAAFINWDLIAVGLLTLGLAAWAARRLVLAGVLVGLAVATKFYPVILLVPLFFLCLRAGRLRAFWITTSSACVAWLAVNLPIALAAPAGWARFYAMNQSRSADWGSIWYFFGTERVPTVGSLSVPALNLVSLLLFGVCCVLIALLIMLAPRRPRLPQVFFLTLAAFLLCNKVWSPQYVIWLLPLVVLARPRLWSYALWQIAEVGYFFAIWAYLITMVGAPASAGGIGNGLYFAALLARFLAVLLLCILVTKDILRPDSDLVRRDGSDDPAGGVLAGAEDRFRPRRAAARHATGAGIGAGARIESEPGQARLAG
jgi:uncharacterized membrane protein